MKPIIKATLTIVAAVLLVVVVNNLLIDIVRPAIETLPAGGQPWAWLLWYIYCAASGLVVGVAAGVSVTIKGWMN